jgi:LuxR family maltose regulon positive regulatory protein
MVSSLVATKICVPRLRSNLVSRSQLVERLEAGLSYPLTLVSAPAGYGKTTMLAELAARIPVAWLSLDESDNDPVRFWTHFIFALQTRQPHMGQAVLQTLVSPELPPLRSLLIELINEVAVDEPPVRPHTIILDDYHLVEEKDIHQDLAFLLEHLPWQLRLMISTRADPPLPLARMRARGQLSEFRAQELRFTSEEINAFLNGVMGLGLSREDIAALDARTEGWIAGLQMAALSMQKQSDIPEFIAAFTGTHRHVFDYLTEEVLGQQTADIQSFLIETSILHHLNGPLCDAVTGRQDGSETLEQLDAANLFLVPLDEERRWYRYQHLFSSLLIGRLQQRQPGRINELYKRAADWFSQNGFADESITYAMAAGDFEMAAELVESAAGEHIIRMEFRTVLNWLAKLPAETVLKHPRLAVFYAFMFSKLGKIDAAEKWLKHVEGVALPPAAPEMAAIAMAHIAMARQDDRRAADLFKSVLEKKEEAGGAGAVPYVTRSASLKLFAAFALSQVQKAQGRLGLAAETCLSALKDIGDVQLKGPWAVFMGWVHVPLAELLYERNELEDALRHARAGIEMANLSGNKSLEAYGVTVLEMILRARKESPADNDYQTSETVNSDAGRLDSEGYSCYPTMTLPLQMRMWFAGGNLNAVTRCVERYRRTYDLDQWRALSLAWPNEPVDISLAYASLAEGKVSEAETRLETLQQGAEKAGRNGNLIEIILLRALAARATGDTARAVGQLRRALSLAEPEGYFRIFVDLGAPMAALLREAESQSSAPQYVRRLLTEFEKKRPGGPAPAYPLLEPLTGRELEVLKLLAEDLSNREIAQKLVLTVGTVKTHAHHIYAKLGVRTRAQAIKRALNLNLL